jgi:hypothetical protein
MMPVKAMSDASSLRTKQKAVSDSKGTHEQKNAMSDPNRTHEQKKSAMSDLKFRIGLMSRRRLRLLSL